MASIDHDLLKRSGFVEGATFDDLLRPAMHIEDQAEADAYFERLVLFYMAYDQTRKRAEEVTRANLGYWAGYGFDRERVEELYRCQHPVFGSVKKNGHPTMEEAFSAGVERGKQR